MQNRYYYSDGKVKQGPLSLEELKDENITKETLIWFEGLDEWRPAGELDSMKPILELTPPPISNQKSRSLVSSPPEHIAPQEDTPTDLKKGSRGWIIVGFVFAILGGVIGFAIGQSFIRKKYDKQTRRLGWIISILSILSMGAWRSLSS